MENIINKKNKKENENTNTNEKETTDPIQKIIYEFKKNYKIIILIIIVVIIISYNNSKPIGYFKHTSKGGFLGSSTPQGSYYQTQVLQQGIGLFRNVSSKCTSGTFVESANRFSTISENILSVLVIIAAIIIIPAFPVVIYIAFVYAIIYKMTSSFRQI
jgi:hypothetical protein